MVKLTKIEFFKIQLSMVELLKFKLSIIELSQVELFKAELSILHFSYNQVYKQTTHFILGFSYLLQQCIAVVVNLFE